MDDLPPGLDELLSEFQRMILAQELRRVLSRDHGEVTLYINNGKVRYIRTTTSREMIVTNTR